MESNSNLDYLCKILATANGKDKLMRLLCYSSYFVASLNATPDELKTPLLKFSSQLSNARTILRLFDDLPMLQYSLQCWKMNEYQDILITINNILDQFYYPVEHLVSFYIFMSPPSDSSQIRLEFSYFS